MGLDPVELEDLGATLAAAVGLAEREHIAIVGGGGKTTTLFALGRQLAPPVVLTTTTKMGSGRDDGYAVLLDPIDAEVASAAERHGGVLVWSARGEHRAEGVAPERCDAWYRGQVAKHVVVEADGSRGRPFKAPYHYEPVVPSTTTIVIACIGAAALGGRIDQVCHRADAAAALLGVDLGDALTPERAARVLVSDRGSRKSVPGSARFVVVVQRVRNEDLAAVRALADALAELDPSIPLIAVAARDGLPPRPHI